MQTIEEKYRGFIYIMIYIILKTGSNPVGFWKRLKKCIKIKENRILNFRRVTQSTWYCR